MGEVHPAFTEILVVAVGEGQDGVTTMAVEVEDPETREETAVAPVGWRQVVEVVREATGILHLVITPGETEVPAVFFPFQVVPSHTQVVEVEGGIMAI